MITVIKALSDKVGIREREFQIASLLNILTDTGDHRGQLYLETLFFDEDIK